MFIQLTIDKWKVSHKCVGLLYSPEIIIGKILVFEEKAVGFNVLSLLTY